MRFEAIFNQKVRKFYILVLVVSSPLQAEYFEPSSKKRVLRHLDLTLYFKKQSFFLILFVSFIGFSQDSNLVSKDSLIHLIETTNGREKLAAVIEFSQKSKRSSAEETLKYIIEGIALADEFKDIKAKAELYRLKGVATFTIGDMEKSLATLKKAIAINKSIKDSAGLGRSYKDLGTYYNVLGDFKTARIHDSLSLSIAERIGDLEMIYQSKKSIADAYLGQGMYLKSQQLYDEVYAFCKTHDLNCASAIVNRAIAINNLGKPSEALGYFFEGRRAFIERGRFDSAMLVEHHIGFLLQQTELYEEALSYYVSVKEFYEKSGNVNRLSAIYLNLGQIMSELDRYNEAENYLQKALDFKKEKGIGTIGDPLVELGVIALKREGYKLAFDYFQEAKQAYEATGDASSIGVVYNYYSLNYLGTHDYKNAEKYALESLAINKQFGLIRETASSYENLVQAYEGQNKFELALQTKKELETINLDLKGSDELLAFTKKLVTETLSKNTNNDLINTVASEEPNTVNSSNSIWLLMVGVLLLFGGLFYYMNSVKKQVANNTVKIEHLQKEEAAAIHETLKQVIKSEKPYLKQEITLNSLAELVGTTDKKLSALLNHTLDISFYDFINQYRVDAIKEKLKSEEYEKYTLLGIAYTCGFNSKSSFYRAFKKETGISPTVYKKEKIS